MHAYSSFKRHLIYPFSAKDIEWISSDAKYIRAMLHNPNLDIWYTQSSMFFRRNS